MIGLVVAGIGIGVSILAGAAAEESNKFKGLDDGLRKMDRDAMNIRNKYSSLPYDENLLSDK